MREGSEGATVEETTTPAATRRTVSDPDAWWRLWSLMVLAHVANNWTTVDFEDRSIPNLVLGLVAISVLMKPQHRWLRTAMAAMIPVSAIAEAPLIGNHWVLAAAVSLAALAARPWDESSDWWRRFAPSARLILLVFYGFAAFAKLNEAFFDPVVSCSRFFANQMLGLGQLPEISAASWLAQLLPFATVVLELSIPVLVVVRRTRGVGVWLAMAFHLFLTLDLIGHFLDFTLVLIPLYLLFAPEGTLRRLDDRLPRTPILRGVPWLVVGAGVVVVTTMPLGETARVLGTLYVRVAWLWLLWIFLRHLVFRKPGAGADSISLKPTSFAAAVIVGLVALNGLSPYLELKTGYGFNMYSNLSTVAGETNHYLVPLTASLRPDQTEVAIILASSDEDFAEYVDSGFALPLINLRHYLAENPGISVSFTVEGERFDLERAGDHPEWIETLPWYLERFAPFRAVPLSDPPLCQPSFLPAR